MSGFEQLDPLVQHHIVNTLGWRELRPLQEASIQPILAGQHCLLLAPTAGGKTESAMFPLLSRMCSERWPATSILYICPLKALINNLGERLDKYARMLGRNASVWHGDVTQSARNQTRVEPSDVLLTTPESLEAMLISTNAVMRSHLRNVQAVVVDEIHAFAGDDRGWHLLCVLDRLTEACGKDMQRVGLSATVGNPDELLAWLVGRSKLERVVINPPSESAAPAEVTLDFVGSLENAATIITRLYRGEKRLVFCDSRSRVEALAGFLRSAGVRTFVSHSSLSAEERRRSEEAFARGEDCVIVATSTLELGIDVGDLDRVIQIDSPTRVASFLQRLGRTGRRRGKARNCLFLCTTEESLLLAAGLLELWGQGFVEPISAPPLPYHIAAQQALAMCLQFGGLAKGELLRRLLRLPLDLGTVSQDTESILEDLVQKQLLATDGMRYFVGEAGESTFGRRNFLELVSVFTSAPVLSVSNGRQELGFVDQNLFATGASPEGRLLSLAGRGWRVVNIDWKDRRVNVAPSEVAGRTVWFGMTRGLSLVLCRAVRGVLTAEGDSPSWSQRAKQRIQEARHEFAFLQREGTTLLVTKDGTSDWYTFAGDAVNSAIAGALQTKGIAAENNDEYVIRFPVSLLPTHLEEAISQLSGREVLLSVKPNTESKVALKFADCLPPNLLAQEVRARFCTAREIDLVLREARNRRVL